jgi:hypothetical protein
MGGRQCPTVSASLRFLNSSLETGPADSEMATHRMADEAHSRYERNTWPILKQLAADVPESGIYFQSEDRLTSCARKLYMLTAS